MEPQHFDKLFYLIVGLIAFGLLYMLLITFLNVPKTNERHVDMILSFLMGSVITVAISYLLGGSPEKTGKKSNNNDL
jgi:hypothetical protein